MPVAIAAELVRVTVGKTEWLLRKLTPSWRRRQRLGVSSAAIESGRSPSSTITTLSVAFPANAIVRVWIRTVRTDPDRAVMIQKDIRRVMALSPFAYRVDCALPTFSVTPRTRVYPATIPAPSEPSPIQFQSVPVTAPTLPLAVPARTPAGINAGSSVARSVVIWTPRTWERAARITNVLDAR